MKTNAFMAVALAIAVHGTAVSGEFINLGFDSPDMSNARLFLPATADVNTHPSVYAPIQEAFHGWQVSFSGYEGSPFYGLVSVGVGYGPLSLSPTGDARLGLYTVYISEYIYGPFPRSGITIAQTGIIPARAETLHFLDGQKNTEVRINGLRQPVRFGPGGGNGYLDVTAFAGQEVNLAFDFLGGMGTTFDILAFEPIPEPSTWALLAMGLGAFGWCRRYGGDSRRV